MKSHNHITTVLTVGFALSLFGCATTGGRIQARIDEKPEAFAQLTKQQQKDIKWGYVKRGFTPDMVYFAFGKPDQIITSPDKTSYVWVYLDRAAINEDIAMISALQQGSKADSTPATPDGAVRFSGSSSNFKGSITTRSETAAGAYSLVDLNGNSDQPTIWVAFSNDEVVNVRHVGGNGNSGKTGSIGG